MKHNNQTTITALYCRLSRDDELICDSNSINNQVCPALFVIVGVQRSCILGVIRCCISIFTLYILL